MGLIIPKPPSWRICTTNLTGTPATPATAGTTVTAGATNADGSAVSGIAAITHDVEYLVLGINGFTASAEDASTLLDVLIDPAGGSSWASDPLISDLLVGQGIGAAGNVAMPCWYHFPIWIKSGASIGFRARTARATTVPGRVFVFAYGGNEHPASWWCGQTVTSIGITAASSKGTDHTPGNSGAYSAWANLGSTLPAPCGALQFAVHGTNVDTTQAALAYYFEFGVSSQRIGPNIYRANSTAESGWFAQVGPIFKSLPSGTQLQVRATCSGTAEVPDVAAYAVH